MERFDRFQGLQRRVCTVCAALGVTILLIALPAGADTGDPLPEPDDEYQQWLQEHPEDQARLDEIDSLLAGDEELEDSYLAYQESLATHPELAARESTFYEILEEDSLLAQRYADFEETAAADSEALEQIAVMDSLLAADQELAGRIEALETAAAEHEELLDEYGDQMSYLQAHPEEAEAFFQDEAEPSYQGADDGLTAFAVYLRARPPLYRAYWRLYRYLRDHPATAVRVYHHWRWVHPRRNLWLRWWRYRLYAARHPRFHRVIWNRRLYLGRRPRLARKVWHHRLVAARRPAWRRALHRHRIFMLRRPGLHRAMVKHRRWIRHHRPVHRHRHKPKPLIPPRPKPKPKPPLRRP